MFSLSLMWVSLKRIWISKWAPDSKSTARELAKSVNIIIYFEVNGKNVIVYCDENAERERGTLNDYEQQLKTMILLAYIIVSLYISDLSALSEKHRKFDRWKGTVIKSKQGWRNKGEHNLMKRNMTDVVSIEIILTVKFNKSLSVFCWNIWNYLTLGRLFTSWEMVGWNTNKDVL